VKAKAFLTTVVSLCPDVNLLRERADGGEERERRAELACEVMHAEIRAVQAQILGGYCQFDRLQKGVGRGAHLGIGRRRPVAEGQKSDLLHARHLGDGRINRPVTCRIDPNNSPRIMGG